LLRAYHRQFQQAKDVAIGLQTGAAKPLIGLLIAEFRRQTLNERVASLSPTRQLTRQVHVPALKYGIKMPAFVGHQRDYYFPLASSFSWGGSAPEEKIENLHLNGVFEDGYEVALADVQIYPSTNKVSFQAKGRTLSPWRHLWGGSDGDRSLVYPNIGGRARAKPMSTSCPTSVAKTPHPLVLALGGLVALAAAVGIGRFVYAPILPLMVEDLGMTKGAAGFLASANFLGYLAGALLAATPTIPGSRRS
jgi:Uncharacterised MFS-type transporter YbfB